MTFPRCGNCGMIGRKEQIKQLVNETAALKKLVVAPICIHCINKKNLCISYTPKHYLTEDEMAKPVFSLWSTEPTLKEIKSGLDMSEVALLYSQTVEKYPELPVRIIMAQ